MKYYKLKPGWGTGTAYKQVLDNGLVNTIFLDVGSGSVGYPQIIMFEMEANDKFIGQGEEITEEYFNKIKKEAIECIK